MRTALDVLRKRLDDIGTDTSLFGRWRSRTRLQDTAWAASSALYIQHKRLTAMHQAALRSDVAEVLRLARLDPNDGVTSSDLAVGREAAREWEDFKARNA